MGSEAAPSYLFFIDYLFSSRCTLCLCGTWDFLYLWHKFSIFFIYVICVYLNIDPSAALRTPVRAGPNGADRVLGDKERRVTDIFPKFDGICPLFGIGVRRMY